MGRTTYRRTLCVCVRRGSPKSRAQRAEVAVKGGQRRKENVNVDDFLRVRQLSSAVFFFFFGVEL
jgi:hypothetical protein